MVDEGYFPEICDDFPNYLGRHGGQMVGSLASGLSYLGSNSGQGHGILREDSD